MKVLLDLPDETLEKFKDVAKKEKRSRKVCMEMVLIGYHKIAAPLQTNGVQKPKNNIPEPELSDEESYENEIQNSRDMEELEATGKEIERDKRLTNSARGRLKILGETKAKEFL